MSGKVENKHYAMGIIVHFKATDEMIAKQLGWAVMDHLNGYARFGIKESQVESFEREFGPELVPAAEFLP